MPVDTWQAGDEEKLSAVLLRYAPRKVAVKASLARYMHWFNYRIIVMEVTNSIGEDSFLML